MDRPEESEYAPFYAGYVKLVPGADALGALEAQQAEFRHLASVALERERYRYEDGKWSVREVAGHLVDAERVFGYRAFAWTRGETAPLPSFDESAYVAASDYDRLPLADIVSELLGVREANLAFLRRASGPSWTFVGTASGRPMSLRALAFVMAGHPRHHLNVLRDRYGLDV